MEENKYKVNVFEIDNGKKKIFVGYSTSNHQQAFEKFVTSVRKERHPANLTKWTKGLPDYDTAEEAIEAAKAVIIALEAKRYMVIAGPMVQNDFWQVYAIELDNNPKKVYIGQSIYDPEIRLEQHMAGLNSSVKVRRADNPKLRPDLYGKIGKIENREEAQKAEIKLAEELREKGFTVYGGH